MFWSRKKPDEPAKQPAPRPHPTTEAAKPGTQFLTGDQELDRRSVEVLLGAIARISESRDLEAKLVDIVDRSIEITGAERGLLVLAQGEVLEVRVARSKDGQTIAETPRFSSSIVRKVLKEDRPMKATVQSDSEALDLGRSVYDLKLRAVMCVPLSTPGGWGEAQADTQRGVLYIDSRAATRDFNPRDLGLFAALSQHISIALENARLHLHSLEKARLEQSLELASAIQNGLMPPIPRDLRGLDVHGWYRPAERTSGDFYDFVKTRDKRLSVVIGDVSGHGIGPALITTSAQACLRSYLKVGSQPAAALSMLNQDLCERIDPGMFLTLCLLVLSEDGRAEVLNAGHPGPLLFKRATGKVESLDAHGPALGFMPETEYGVDVEAQLATGDVLIAFTDGLIEAHAAESRDELFGIERLAARLQDLGAEDKSAEEITRTLAEAVLAFSGKAHEDDLTLVVVKKV